MPYVNAGYQAGEFKIFKSRYQQGSQMLNATYYLALRYPLFTWFAESAEKNADLLREKRAQHNASIAWLHLANGIRREFFNAVILKNQIALKEKQIALEKQHQGRLDENLAAGVSAETNRLSQSVALREKQFDHDGAKVRLADLVTRLRTLSGLETFTEADIPSSVPSPEVDCAVLERRLAAYAQAVAAGETASARVARIEREILDDEITQVRARKLPTFNLGATISQNPYDAGGNRGYEMRNILFFGISGNWNLFDRDITNTTIRSIQTRQRLIDARLSSEKINRENSLRNLIGQIRSAQELLAIRREYEKNAAQHLAGLRESLRLGLYTELDVETAEARLDNLRLGIAENQTAIVRDFYEFLAGIGQDPAAYYYTAPNNE
ncbi:MAG: TolC family protein [Puniceicoccales bacterium]|nr:TolC family protein [Puniceicoccales bacterium]